MSKIELNIQPLLDTVNEVIRNEIDKLFYDMKIKSLTKDLEDCRRELEKYRKMRYTIGENIVLKIEEKEDDLESLVVGVDNDDDNSIDTNSSMEANEKKNIKTVFLDVKPDIQVGVEQDDEEEKEEEEEEEVEEEEEEQEEEEEEEEEVEEEEQEEVEEEQEEVDEEGEEEVEEEEEEEEVEEVEEVEEEEEEEVEEEEEEQKEEADEEEEEVFEIEIDDVSYFTNNDENGILYAVDENGDPGNKVGYLKDGEPFFY